MCVRLSYLFLLFILVSCTPDQNTGIKLVAGMETRSVVPTYNVGQPVEFHINATVYFCTDQDGVFSIRQVTGHEYRREIRLEHSCVGTEGTGFDQFCRNGEVETTFIGQCSDAIVCMNWAINETISWDQLEYVQIEEECVGRTIHREVQQQVPEGKYEIVIPVLINEEIHYESVEFIISSDAEGP